MSGDTAAARREVAAWSASILSGTDVVPGAPVDLDAHPPGSAEHGWADGWHAAAVHARVTTGGETL